MQKSASLPSYCRHRGRNQGYVRLDGKQIYLGTYGSEASIKRYERVLAEWMAGEFKDECATVVELCAAYLDYAKAYYRKNGRPTSEIHSIKRAIRKLCDLYGDLDIYEFSPKKLTAIQASWVQSDIARSTINHYVGAVKRIFRWGVKEELVPAEVYQALATVGGLPKGRSLARETAPVKPVDIEVVIAMLEHLPRECADLVRLQLATAMRPGEALAMRPVNIDRSSDPWVYTPGSHKTEHHDRTRVIYLNRDAQQVVTPYLFGEYCFNRYRHGGAYRRCIQRMCDRLKIPRWSPNQLRHTAATTIRERFGLEAAQVVLGHSRANMTETYAERNQDLAKKVVNGLVNNA